MSDDQTNTDAVGAVAAQAAPRVRLSAVRQAIAETVWAILPGKMDAILDVVEAHAIGDGFTAEEIEARLGGAPRARGAALPQVTGKVAVLPVFGTLAQRVSGLSAASGGVSAETIGAQFDALVRDPDVGAIVLNVDSPGGSVSGIPELAAKIHAARGSKPVVAVANALMASAAYWIASAADEVVATPSAQVGSIGVFAVHMDRTGMDAQLGLKRTIVRAGRYKAEGNPFEPFGDEARAAMQAQVDELYGMFTDAVATHRGVNAAAVRAGYGEGRLLTAAQATAAGMVDRLATLDAVVAELTGRTQRASTSRASAAGATTTVSPVAADSPAADAARAAVAAPATQPAPEARRVTVSAEHTAAPGAAPTGTASPAATVDYVGLARAYRGSLDDVQRWQAASLTEAQVRADLMDRLRGGASAVNAAAPTDNPLGISAGEQRRYSILAAINASLSGNWQRAGYEREVSQALSKALSRESENGVFVPTGAGFGPGFHAAGHDTATATKGAELKFTEAGSFIEMLRNRAMVMQLGATVLPGLQGKVAFPRQTGAGAATWAAQNPGADSADSDTALDQVTLDLKTLISNRAYSKQLLAQGTIDVDAYLRRDLAAVIALAIDLAALHGTGAANQPTGIYSAVGVNAVAMGGAITFAKVVAMETEIEKDNADISTMAYLTTPGVKGNAKTTLKAAGVSGYLWEDGEMNGYRAEATNQVASNLGAGTNEHGIAFGCWDQLLIGEWGAMEIIADPYRLKKQAMVELTATAFVDVALRYAQAFSKGTGLTAT